MPHLSLPKQDPLSTALTGRLVVALAVLMAGCAMPAPSARQPATTAASAPATTAPPAVYSVPKGSPTARLVMRGAVQAGDQFGIYALDDPVLCKTPRRVGVGTPQKQPDPAHLAAGVLTTLDFVIVKPARQQCLVRWTFTPVAGRSYTYQGSASSTGCAAVLLDVTRPDQLIPAEGALRRNLPGQACLPLDKSPPAPRSPLEGGQSDGDAVLNPTATPTDLEGLIRP